MLLDGLKYKGFNWKRPICTYPYQQIVTKAQGARRNAFLLSLVPHFQMTLGRRLGGETKE